LSRALAGTGLRPAALRQRALRPQLKRDPLGSYALMLLRRRRRESLARDLLIAALATLIAVMAGVEWLGQPLRLVHVLTLVADGMVVGTPLTHIFVRWRRARATSVNEPAA
jgi:hypothetical protein